MNPLIRFAYDPSDLSVEDMPPKFKELAEMLIHVGKDFGYETSFIVFDKSDPDLDNIIERGVPYSGKKARMIRGMEASRCHANSACVYDSSPKYYRLMTGYVADMSREEKGTIEWRQHTWLYSPATDSIRETTVKRVIYFGFILNEKESDQFVYDNYY